MQPCPSGTRMGICSLSFGSHMSAHTFFFDKNRESEVDVHRPLHTRRGAGTSVVREGRAARQETRVLSLFSDAPSRCRQEPSSSLQQP